MIEIENTLCVTYATIETSVFQKEREQWGATSILSTVNDGVYIYLCSDRYDQCMCKKKHAFFNDHKFKPLHQ